MQNTTTKGMQHEDFSGDHPSYFYYMYMPTHLDTKTNYKQETTFVCNKYKDRMIANAFSPSTHHKVIAIETFKKLQSASTF